MNTLHWEGYIRFGIYAAKKNQIHDGKTSISGSLPMVPQWQ